MRMDSQARKEELYRKFQEDPVEWFIADAFLDSMESVLELPMRDPDFNLRFNALREYVNKVLYGEQDIDF